MFPSVHRVYLLGGLFLLASFSPASAGPKLPHGGTTFFPVTTTADSGPGSLRNAVNSANDGDYIYFFGLDGQTITLTSGELLINKTLTINGPGANLLTVARDPQASAFRIFHLIGPDAIQISGLTIRNGSDVGAGIWNEHATLSLTNCVISENSTPDFGNGGGIYNDGSGGSATLIIVGCNINGNAARGYGGGIYNIASNGGSAILALWNSSVSNNVALHFDFTSPYGAGGGIYSDGPGASATITNCTVNQNVAGNHGPPVPSGSGGGILNGGTLTIINSTIANNQVGMFGGGIATNGSLLINNSSIFANSADGTTDSLLFGEGGGIYNNSGSSTITNSTVADNYAKLNGGGIRNNNGTAVFSVTNSTLSGNRADQSGGGVYNQAGQLQIGNTILKAGTSGANVVNNGGIITSLGYNLSSDNGGGFLKAIGDLINTDPILGPLQNNGGPTVTNEPMPGSPAINAGNPKFTPPPLFDQRGLGYNRVFNGRLDIGSLEVQPHLTPTPSPSPTSPPCGIIIFIDENFDGLTPPALPPGWVSNFVSGPANCTPTGTCPLGTNWMSEPGYAFHDAPGCVIDSTLDTPFFEGGATNGTFLYLDISFDLENGRDGAVLEISINGGPFVDFVAAGGGNLYNGTISTEFHSPIAGRPAWTGTGGGVYEVPMPGAALGRDIQLRFRVATDCSGSSTGFRINYIKVLDNIGCGGSPTPTPTPFTPSPTPTATIPPPTATPIPTPCGLTFGENFDGVTAPALPTGWRTTTTGKNGVQWATSTFFPTSGQNEVFTLAAFDIGSSQLMSPDITVPVTGGILSFQNLFNLQEGFDGMVLELSINGGSYTDIIAAGGTFVTGGYTHTISTCCGSPIAGRMAWSGVSAGTTATPFYITTTVNLPAIANGQVFILRWRVAYDNFSPIVGMVRMDSIVLTPSSCGLPSPTPTPGPARPLNLSTRMLVQTGDNVGIGGFIITGTSPKRILLRGIGPSLSQFGIPNALADPTMELHGPAGFTTITNDNWRDVDGGREITETGLAPTNDLESAILWILQPGNYTAIVKGKNDGTGVGLVEVFDLGDTTSELGNISTRAFVGADGDVMIGGFILGGGDSTNVFIRGLGPSLSSFGIPNPLADPTLELRDTNGILLAENDNCSGGPIPVPSPESCIEISLPAGAFTAILAGKDGGTGVGLVEIYNLH